MVRSQSICGKIAFVAALLAFVPYLATAQSMRERVEASDIVFVGTVVEMGAASFAGVPVSKNTIIVTVDSVVRAPQLVPLRKGERVTVAVKDPAQFRPSTRATFFAAGWILGDGVAVKEVGHVIEPTVVSSTMVAEKQQSLGQAQQEIDDSELRRRIAAAQAVVVGRVMSVRPETMSMFVEAPKRITEHDPDWQEAVIKVESAIKGAAVSQELVVRFPASIDVQWFGAPKFSVGQEGTFILDGDKTSGAPLAMHAGAQVQAYTALAPQQILSKEDAGRVRALAGP